MAASSSNNGSKIPHQELPKPTSAEITTQQQQLQLQSSPNPTTPTLAADTLTPTTDSKETTPATVTPRPPEPPSTDSDVIHIPSYSRWFSWNNIHECEVRFLPEFFDGRSASKNPRVYKYYRNMIIRSFRVIPTRKITFTEARKTIIGDVGSVRRVFDFLEAWGLINYSGSGSGSKPQMKLDDKDSKSNAASSQSNDPGGTTSAVDSTAVPKKRVCGGCKTVCTIACFASDKHDLTLCARCYVRGKYRVGVNSTDFKRVEISEEIKTDWTDKETLHLLEAIMHYGDDWKKVAVYVGGRTDKECVAHFIKLPFGEQFVGPPDSADVDDKFYQTKDQSDAKSGLQGSAAFSPTKRMRLTPLADASNPIMAQAAFLSALVGAEVAEVAAHAAVRAFSEANNATSKESVGSLTGGARELESYIKSNDESTKNLEGAYVEAQLQLEKEEQDLERAISGIAEVQTKEIQDKIVHFEELELQMEREWQQLQQMKDLLFVDQLTLLFHKNAAPKTGESIENNVKIE